MFKKIIAWLLVVILTAGIAIGGTLAYLTDRDSEANVFTAGDVKIDLNEDFSQGSTLIPGVNIEKKPTITNVGSNDAWVWATVAVPAGLDPVIAFEGQGAGWQDWTKSEEVVEIHGKNYILYTALYNPVLGVENVTDALFETAALANTVDIDPDGNWYTVSAGIVEPLNWNNDDGYPTIYVSAYAIQTEGFEDVNAAYAAYGVQWGNKGTEYAVPANVLDTNDELREAAKTSANHIVAEDINLTQYAISNGEDIETTINLNGYTVTVDGVPGVSRSGVAFVAQNGASLEMNGPGCLDMNYAPDEKPEYSTPFLANKNATVTVNGGEYLMGACEYDYHIFCQNSAKIIINDGTFITSNPNAAIAYCINGFIEINGGFFQNTANPKQALLSMGNNLKYANNQKITISGGTFVNWNPMSSAFARPWTNPDVPAMIVLADGCEVVSETQANGDIWYTVVKA